MRRLGDIAATDLGRDAMAQRLETLAGMLDLPPGPGPDEALRVIMQSGGDVSKYAVAIGLPSAATLADIAEAIGADYSDEQKTAAVVLSATAAIWDDDSALREEFGGDRSAYNAYMRRLIAGEAQGRAPAVESVSLSDAMDRWGRDAELRAEFGNDKNAFIALCNSPSASKIIGK